MNHEPQTFERELAALSPSRVPARLFERIEAGIAALPGPALAKVVPFPAPGRATSSRQPRWLAVAAAVALVGGVAAFLAPDQGPQTPVAQQAVPVLQVPTARSLMPGQRTPGGVAGSPSQPASPSQEGFVPADSRAGVREVRDEGLHWTPDHQPLRRVRVDYYQRITLVNEHGEKIEIDIPRVEYLLLPEKIH